MSKFPFEIIVVPGIPKGECFMVSGLRDYDLKSESAPRNEICRSKHMASGFLDAVKIEGACMPKTVGEGLMEGVVLAAQDRLNKQAAEMIEKLKPVLSLAMSEEDIERLAWMALYKASEKKAKELAAKRETVMGDKQL